MAFNEDTSFIEYPVDQPTQDFVTNFDTIGGTTDVVLVSVDGVLTDTPESSYTVQQINLTTWRVTPEVQSGSVVRLYRVTNTDEMMHVFTAGAKFIARNMDNNFKQIRHSQQEVHDDFSSLAANTSLRLDTFSDRVDALNTEFITTQAVVSDLVTVSADTVSTANTALSTANAIDAKASTALSNSSTALSTATGIDAKATDALDNSLAAVLDSSEALNTANGIDAKATRALTDSATALSSATTALNTANAIDDKATQALTNSTGALKSSNNLSDLASATTARANLGVMSSSEVTTAISNATPIATETTAGKAKIATTALAQEGINDTDFLTPLKLRNALNANGSAPIYACRAWVNFNGVGTVAILGSGNVSSITDNGIGDYTVSYIVALPDTDYAIIGSSTEYSDGTPITTCLRMSGTTPLLKTSMATRIATRYAYSSAFYDINNIYLEVTR